MKQIDFTVFFKEILLRILTANYAVFRQIVSQELRGRAGKVLDLGCGTGIMSSEFADNSYTGIDIDGRLISFAKDRYVHKRFQVMDATNLTFPPGSFDTILIVGVIHHLSDSQVKDTLRHVRRVVRPEGIVLAIEAIPPLSSFNIPGRFLRAFDEGAHIRTLDRYVELFTPFGSVEKAYTRQGGLFDYGVCLVRMSSNLKRTIS